MSSRRLAEAQRIAAAYPPEARHTPAWERARFLTETQQLAWLLRFDPEAAAEALSAEDTENRQGTSDLSQRDQIIPHNSHHRQAFAGDKV